MVEKNIKPKTTFFNFIEIKNLKNYKISYYKGWHNLLILRICLSESIDLGKYNK